MRKVAHILLFTLIALIFVTCKKQELAPSTVENQPIFSFYGNMGGNILNVQAGVNNYYMYSSDTSIQSIASPGTGVYSFIGTLRNTATANNSIQIIINDDAYTPPSNQSDINNSITSGTSYFYNIPGGTPVWDSVIFIPKMYVGKPKSLSFNFGDGNAYNTSNTAPVPHLYKILKDYNTQLTVNSFDSGVPSSITISNPLRLNSKSTTPISITSVKPFLLADFWHKHEVSLWAYISGGTFPYTYKWSYGNGHSDSISSGNSINTIYTYTDSVKTYPITLTVTDFTKKDTASFMFYYTDTVSSNNSVAYSMAVHPVANPSGLSTVTINYTDAQGRQYTSNNSSQARNNTFQITSVANYQNNKDNNPTKMLKVSFNCMLYNAALHDSIAATNCTAVIAVAYH